MNSFFLQNQFTAKKMKFSIKNIFGKCDQNRSLVTFTKEILKGKLHFLCSNCFDQRGCYRACMHVDRKHQSL